MEIYSPQPDIEISTIVESANELNEVLKIHQMWNLDEIMAPFLEILPDTNEPLHAILTMHHIYDIPAIEIVSVLIDAQHKPLNNSGWEKSKMHLKIPDKLPPQPELDNSVFIKNEYAFHDLNLPDNWDLESADLSRLQRRIDITEDIICYLGEGIRRISENRSPAFMVENTHQIECLTSYLEHLKSRVDAFNSVRQQLSQISLHTEIWKQKIGDIFELEDDTLPYALDIAYKDFKTIKNNPLNINYLSNCNYTEAQAIQEDCNELKRQINQMSDTAKEELNSRQKWLDFVAHLDEWRDQLSVQAPRRLIDWRHDCVIVPVVNLDDDLLPSNRNQLIDSYFDQEVY